MLAALLLLTQGPSQETIAKIDNLAKARDIAGLSAYLAPYKGRNPLSPIKTGGCYGVGRYGWRAMYVHMANASFILFTTPLTSEDIGELLFKFGPDGKLIYVPEEDTNGLKIISHDFNVRFNLPKKAAIIQDTIELHTVARRDLPPMIRLGPNYKVSKIVDGTGKEIAFLQPGGIVFLYTAISNQKLTLHYAGTVDLPEYAGSISDKEAMLTNDYWWPMIGRQPAPYRLTVTVPKTWVPVAQGDLLEEQIRGENKVSTFEMKIPVSYYSLSAAPYTTVKSQKGKREFRMWSTSLSKTQMEMQNELYPPIIDFYERFAKYPFTGWGAVVSDVYGGGALEAYSFATYGGGMPGEDGHETAHTWWGGLISNTYLKSLWNESFANFSAGMYARNVPIGNVEERRLAFIETPNVNNMYNVASLAEGSPFVGSAAVTLGYGKGGYVLQMLESEVGTDKMIAGMKEWQRVHDKMQGGEWEDFEAALDRAGNDTQWFFRQWVHKPGYVDFDVEGLQWTNGRLVGKVVFKSEPYVLNSEVLIEDVNGKRTFLKAPLSTNLRDKSQQFVIPCLVKPKLVSFDPWRRIVRPIENDETPVELQSVLRRASRYTDSAHTDWLHGVGSARKVEALPEDLNGLLIVGHPSTTPRMKPLCEKAGFEVSGNKLTYKGTEIDLTKGAALAVVDLGEGKSCVIGLGQTRRRPDYGRARTAVVDDLGRFLRGVTDPKTAGHLTFDKF